MLQSHLHQIDGFACRCLLLHVLNSLMKTLQTDELFRRNTDIITEDTQELPFAKASHGCHLRSRYIASRPVASRYHFAQARIINVLFMRQMTKKECEPLRYMMRRVSSSRNSQSEIITVPDHEMENFMRVASVQDESVMFLDYKEFIGKEGRRVRINEGAFAGVEGVIKRIKRNKHVVVQIEGVTAVAITFVPSSYLSII